MVAPWNWLKLETLQRHMEHQQQYQEKLSDLKLRFPAEQDRVDALYNCSVDLEADTWHLLSFVHTRVYFEDLVDEPNPFETEERFAREQSQKNALYPRIWDFQAHFKELQQSLEDPKGYQIKLLQQEVRELRDDLAKEIDDNLQTQIALHAFQNNREHTLVEENLRLRNELAELKSSQIVLNDQRDIRELELKEEIISLTNNLAKLSSSQNILVNERDSRVFELATDKLLVRTQLDHTVADAARTQKKLGKDFRRVERQKQDLEKENMKLQNKLKLLKTSVQAMTKAVQDFGRNGHNISGQLVSQPSTILNDNVHAQHVSPSSTVSNSNVPPQQQSQPSSIPNGTGAGRTPSRTRTARERVVRDVQRLSEAQILALQPVIQDVMTTVPGVGYHFVRGHIRANPGTKVLESNGTMPQRQTT